MTDTTDNTPDENKLIAERRAKLAQLREAGNGNAFPNDFRRDALAGQLHDAFGERDSAWLEANPTRVQVGGRILFKGADIFGSQPLSFKQLRLSNAMVSYWTQFAKTGNPNSSGEPAWDPYSASVDQFQSFIPPTPVVESNFDTTHLCSAFWDTF